MKTNNTKPSTIAICVEVASPKLMTEWLDAGWMPNLAQLRDKGVWAPLESITELSSGSLWPSFYTGVHPAKNGQFFTHMQLEPGTYRIVKKYANDVPCDPFWTELHKAGRSSTIVDVAQSRPVEGFNGVHVAGWGSEFPAWKRSSAPRSLMPEIIKRFGSHPLTDQYRLAVKPETTEGYAGLREELIHGVRTKAALSQWLLDNHSHDFFLTVFPESHWATHLLWDALDEDHPRRSPTYADNRECFRQILGTIDDFIGAAQRAHPDADIFVFSLSGMGPNYSGWHILPEFLQKLGMSAEPKGLSRWMPMARWGAWNTRKAEGLIGHRAVEKLKRLLPKRIWDNWTRRFLFAGGEWANSRVFWVPNDYSGALRVNLQGREPRGKVAPGAEYESVCNEVTSELLELRHVDTGRPIVRDVIRPQQMWQGPYASVLPDLLVLWANETLINGVHSERVGTIRCEYPERRTGAHRREAFLAAAGPHIANGVLPKDANILDLAPTFLRLAGVDVPDDYDGRVIQEMLQTAQAG
jgi:predicted AlkP superfamily phosphohydrolase/phosphomutase